MSIEVGAKQGCCHINHFSSRQNNSLASPELTPDIIQFLIAEKRYQQNSLCRLLTLPPILQHCLPSAPDNFYQNPDFTPIRVEIESKYILSRYSLYHHWCLCSSVVLIDFVLVLSLYFTWTDQTNFAAKYNPREKHERFARQEKTHYFGKNMQFFSLL